MNKLFRASHMLSRYGRVEQMSFLALFYFVNKTTNESILKSHFFLCALTMFDFDFCNALPVRARVGSGTITAIYYYYYYYYYLSWQ